MDGGNRYVCCRNGAAKSHILTGGSDRYSRAYWDYGERLRLEGGKGGGVARSRFRDLEGFKMERSRDRRILR